MCIFRLLLGKTREASVPDLQADVFTIRFNNYCFSKTQAFDCRQKRYSKAIKGGRRVAAKSLEFHTVEIWQA
jgi:hypothetical protein